MNGQAPSGAVSIPAGHVHIEGTLEWPGRPATGIVLIAHGSGSSRLSPRNNFVALEFRRAGLATLLLDLLTPEEDIGYASRFDIGTLAGRLVDAVAYLDRDEAARPLPVGVMSASTAAAAALQMAASLPDRVKAVVSCGGRPDLAGNAVLAEVRAPTLFIVGGLDSQVMELNDEACRELGGVGEIKMVPGATHLFEETGALERVADFAGAWFSRYLVKGG